MPNGYDKPLYIISFDHRHSYLSKLFQWQEPLTAEETAEVAASKQLVYEDFKAAVANGVPPDLAGILVDEEFGSAILRDAVGHDASLACRPRRAGRGSLNLSEERISGVTMNRMLITRRHPPVIHKARRRVELIASRLV
jgi:myo-inositol catabolism protein IolC